MKNKYLIDITKNYTDLFLLLNDKEKLDSFFNYMLGFIVKETEENLESKGDSFFPVAIKNEKAKVVELDYNVLVKCVAYWAKDELEFSQWKEIIDIFSYSFLSNTSKATNQSVFLTSVIFGMHHRATSVGFDIKYGTTGYKHLNSIPIIYKSKNSGELMQYAMVTIYMKKIEKSTSDNGFKERFENIISYAASEFEQIAFGVKACKDEWGSENQNHYSL